MRLTNPPRLPDLNLILQQIVQLRHETEYYLILNLVQSPQKL